MSDEWRVEVQLGEEGHGLSLGERLRTLDLDDDARKRLGDRVVVTRDGPRIFLYAGDEAAAREAEGVARELVADDGLDAQIAVTRWHPVEEAWKDPSMPLPESADEVAAEERRHEAVEARSGDYEWEVRVDLPSLGDAGRLAERLRDEGFEVKRRWKHLLVGATSEEGAADLAERIRAEGPPGTDVQVEPRGDVPHPVFVWLGAHDPGRDIGL
jgi:hypothetical protein